jgi:hypothetical protein
MNKYDVLHHHTLTPSMFSPHMSHNGGITPAICGPIHGATARYEAAIMNMPIRMYHVVGGPKTHFVNCTARPINSIMVDSALLISEPLFAPGALHPVLIHAAVNCDSFFGGVNLDMEIANDVLVFNLLK